MCSVDGTSILPTVLGTHERYRHEYVYETHVFYTAVFQLDFRYKELSLEFAGDETLTNTLTFDAILLHR